MDNVTLNIGPGVVVKFNTNVQLSLRGKLIGHGTLTDTIRFMANTSVTAYNGVYVDNSSYNPKVDLRFFKATEATNLFKVASLGSADTLLKFTRCVFQNNNTILDQYDGTKTHKVYIDSCVFTNISNYVNAGASNNIIKNSKFYGTYRAFYNSTQQNTIIDNCEFSGYTSVAVLVNGIITNSNFFNNQVAICTMDLNSPIIKYNNIHDNNTGIEAWNFGSSNSTTQINFNKICNNTNGVKKIYSPDTYVPNNCWCMSDSAQIQSVVYDFFDAPNLGLIFYTPFDVNCTYSGPVGLKTIKSLNISSVNIYPNPFNNLFAINTNFIQPTVVEINLLDPLGNTVCKIYNGQVNNGYQNINFNSDQLTSGIYFLTIKSDNETLTKKIIKL
jgi:hypothetical protein